MINREFSMKDIIFRQRCSEVNIEPTIRQASKYRMKKGKAFNGNNKVDVSNVVDMFYKKKKNK